MTYEVTRDAGTLRLTVKRFGYEGLARERFDSLKAATDRALELSRGMTGREVAVISSDSRERQGVELYAFQDGAEVERRGPFVKRVK